MTAKKYNTRKEWEDSVESLKRFNPNMQNVPQKWHVCLYGYITDPSIFVENNELETDIVSTIIFSEKDVDKFFESYLKNEDKGYVLLMVTKESKMVGPNDFAPRDIYYVYGKEVKKEKEYEDYVVKTPEGEIKTRFNKELATHMKDIHGLDIHKLIENAVKDAKESYKTEPMKYSEHTITGIEKYLWKASEALLESLRHKNYKASLNSLKNAVKILEELK